MKLRDRIGFIFSKNKRDAHRKGQEIGDKISLAIDAYIEKRMAQFTEHFFPIYLLRLSKTTESSGISFQESIKIELTSFIQELHLVSNQIPDELLTNFRTPYETAKELEIEPLYHLLVEKYIQEKVEAVKKQILITTDEFLVKNEKNLISR